VVAGPLIGGVFANSGNWRGAFFTVAGGGCLIAIGVLAVLPAGKETRRTPERRFPIFRVTLICAAIALLSLAGVSAGPASRGVLIGAALAAFALILRIDRRATAPMMPSDAFSLRSATGAGLWMIWLLSAGYSPLAIYAPLFLQRLHQLSPLNAGYMVAAASLAWTTGALLVAPLANEWPARLMIAGPAAMSAGLIGVGMLIGPGPVPALLLPVALIGMGIGGCWAFLAQHVMSSAKDGEETIAAASIATVQQAGIAFGAAIAGLVANISGIGDALVATAVSRAAFWVPIVFVAAPLAASAIGICLTAIARSAAIADRA
jgi:predicted MFS family arabinose efflux permease